MSVWFDWGGFARLFMWASMIATGGLTAGLIAFGPCRSAAQEPHA